MEISKLIADDFEGPVRATQYSGRAVALETTGSRHAAVDEEGCNLARSASSTSPPVRGDRLAQRSMSISATRSCCGYVDNRDRPDKVRCSSSSSRRNCALKILRAHPKPRERLRPSSRRSVTLPLAHLDPRAPLRLITRPIPGSSWKFERATSWQ
jgi:hypothetical protein